MVTSEVTEQRIAPGSMRGGTWLAASGSLCDKSWIHFCIARTLEHFAYDAAKPFVTRFLKRANNVSYESVGKSNCTQTSSLELPLNNRADKSLKWDHAMPTYDICSWHSVKWLCKLFSRRQVNVKMYPDSKSIIRMKLNLNFCARNHRMTTEIIICLDKAIHSFATMIDHNFQWGFFANLRTKKSRIDAQLASYNPLRETCSMRLVEHSTRRLMLNESRLLVSLSMILHAIDCCYN